MALKACRRVRSGMPALTASAITSAASRGPPGAGKSLEYVVLVGRRPVHRRLALGLTH